ncbi:Os03g0741950 [Oryza sativa Japonica Group]|uniref:Os03g0741950 protein n=1 Tax=Oryza sativa subsp. japonica TaxID=39947 RepID=A0A0P0W2X2_ORYSJ|nr:Os03g0741950 [Oryza sativa Japonica Group]
MSRLAGELSPAIANLTQLELLINLTSNAFSGSIPDGLGWLRRMWYLSLCDNAFAGEIPDALRNCTALDVAYLNNNNLDRRRRSTVARRVAESHGAPAQPQLALRPHPAIAGEPHEDRAARVRPEPYGKFHPRRLVKPPSAPHVSLVA